MNRREVKNMLAAGVVVCAGLCAGEARAKVTIDLDYSLDVNGFFLPKAQNPFGFDGDAAKAVLQRAAQTFSDRFVDHLTEVANVPGIDGGEWSQTITHPGTGTQQYDPGLTTVAADVIKVYAGGRDLPGSTLGLGGPGGVGYSYFPGRPLSEAWRDNVVSRGQAGALTTPETDFGPWGGSISFDTMANWHIGLSTTGLTATKSDFLSVALHEMAHLLGVGTAQSWDDAIAGGQFAGAASSAVHGGPVPLSGDLAHWLEGAQSTVGAGGPQQEAAMDPSLTTGRRKRITLLDWAGLDDLGWQIAGAGDATADGAVDFNDLVALAQHYNSMTGQMRWAEGDFTEDGNVDFADLVLLAQNYNSGGASVEVAERYGAAFAADWGEARALAAAGVPEPGIGVLAAGAGVVLARRPSRGCSVRRGAVC